MNRFELSAIRHCMRMKSVTLPVDVSWAVLGFAGNGTTSLIMHLHGHPELEVFYEPDRWEALEEHFCLSRDVLRTCHHADWCLSSVSSRRHSLEQVACVVRNAPATCGALTPIRGEQYSLINVAVPVLRMHRKAHSRLWQRDLGNNLEWLVTPAGATYSADSSRYRHELPASGHQILL